MTLRTVWGLSLPLHEDNLNKREKEKYYKEIIYYISCTFQSGMHKSVLLVLVFFFLSALKFYVSKFWNLLFTL